MTENKYFLIRICDKIIAEKYSIPTDFSLFFEWVPEQGMKATEGYIEKSQEYKYIDMQYNLFNWQQGVGFYSLMLAQKLLKTEKYGLFVKEWVDSTVESRNAAATVNNTAPYLAILELYRQIGEQRYYDLCEERARFCMAEAKRANEGVFEHTVNGITKDFESQIWSDTLFMAALFLAEWGSLVKKRMYQKEAARQMILHYKYLQDTETGLLFHAYNCRLRSHMSSVRWGRANGWGIVAGSLICELLPDDMEEKSVIRQNFLSHLKAFSGCQRPDGGFCTVLDRPETYEETTAVSMFLFGVYKARELGWIHEEYSKESDKAYSYLISHISSDGEVLGTSGGTPVMYSAEEYNRIPCVMSYYGQGLAVMALLMTTEFSRKNG